MSEFGLWALMPELIGQVTERHAVEGIIPEALRALMGNQARAPADPIRDGATLIVPLDGVLSPRGTYGGTSTERFADQVRAAGTDDKVGAVVLRITSPGGLVWGTQEAADAVFETRALKPIVAVASPLAASAAVWIGAQASAFYGSTSADVGSIGVYGSHTDKSGFEDKIGMKTSLISSTVAPKKTLGNPYAALTDDDRAELQIKVDEETERFVSAVARGRGVPASKVTSDFGQGGMMSAHRAVAAGMLDGVMTLRDVVAKYGSSRTRLALMRRRAEAHKALYSI